MDRPKPGELQNGNYDMFRKKSLIGRFEPIYSVGHYFEKFKVFIDDAHRSFDLIWFY